MRARRAVSEREEEKEEKEEEGWKDGEEMQGTRPCRSRKV